MLNDLCAVCSKGFVQGQHIMRFREQLQKHGYCQSFTTDEKGQSDPQAPKRSNLILRLKLKVLM